MFYFLEDFDIANYADYSTPYCAGKSAEFVDPEADLGLLQHPRWSSL